MKKILLSIAILLLLTSIGYCQEEPLQLTIKSDKEAYEVGEEIKIQLDFQNNSPEKVIIFKHMLMTYNVRFQVNVTTPAGERYEPVTELRHYELPVFDMGMYQKILPDETFTILISLKDYFGESYEDFIVAGNCKISAKYSNEFDYYYNNGEETKIDAFKGTLTSNTITIEVVGEKVAKPSCPKCGLDKDVIPISYGLPSPEMMEQAERGEIELGGCMPVVGEEWFCKTCEHRW